MSQIKRIGLDTSKAVFTLHCVDQGGHAVLRTNLRRAQMAIFFRNLAPAEIALEACGSSHHMVSHRHAAAARDASRQRIVDRPTRPVQAKAVIVAEVERLRWWIWNGKAENVQRSIDRIRTVMHVFKGEQHHTPRAARLHMGRHPGDPRHPELIPMLAKLAATRVALVVGCWWQGRRSMTCAARRTAASGCNC
jgi:transposase